MDTSQTPSSTLFIADVPTIVQESEFVAVFQAQEGFKAARLRKDKNNHVVGFADFLDSESAALAMETLQGYKFNIADKGLTIHFAHNATLHVPRNSSNNSNTRTDSQMEKQNKVSLTIKEPNTNIENGKLRITNTKSKLTFMPDLQNTISSTPISNPLNTSNAPQHSNNSHSTTLNNSPLGNTGNSNVSPQPNGNNSNYVPLSLFHQTYPNILPSLPGDASSTLYVEGLPMDATEREVAHIFRPFPGYQSLRIISKESKNNPNKVYNLCFVEFDNKYQATFALSHLQGYRMDKDDAKGLTMSYAKTERKIKLQNKAESSSRKNAKE